MRAATSLSTWSPTSWPCFYGVDTPHREKLLAEEAAYADWTIVVESEPDDSGSSNTLKRTFSVHRVMIGPKCSYFDAAFSGAFLEESQRITKLQFPRDVVEHFHLFLDYCYDPIFDDDLRETNIIETMTLFVLADYLAPSKSNPRGGRPLKPFAPTTCTWPRFTQSPAQ